MKKNYAVTPGKSTNSFQYKRIRGTPAGTVELNYEDASEVSAVTPGLKRKRVVSTKVMPAPPVTAVDKATRIVESKSNQWQANKKISKNNITHATKAELLNREDIPEITPYPDIKFVPKSQVESIFELAIKVIKNESRGLALGFKQANKEARKVFRAIKMTGDVVMERLNNEEVELDSDVSAPIRIDLDQGRAQLNQLKTIFGLYQEEERQLDDEEVSISRKMNSSPDFPEIQEDDSDFENLLKTMNSEFVATKLNEVLDNIEAEANAISKSLNNVQEICHEAEDVQQRLYDSFEKWQFAGYINQKDAKSAIRGLLLRPDSPKS